MGARGVRRSGLSCKCWDLGGGQRRGGGGAPAGYCWGPGSPGWRRLVLPYRLGEDAPPGKKEAGRERLGRRRMCMEGDGERDSTVGTPADVLGGRLVGDSTVGSPADVLGRRRVWLGGGVRRGGGVGGTLGEAVVRLPLTGCTSDPRGRPGRVAAVTGLTRPSWGGGGGSWRPRTPVQ